MSRRPQLGHWVISHGIVVVCDWFPVSEEVRCFREHRWFPTRLDESHTDLALCTLVVQGTLGDSTSYIHAKFDPTLREHGHTHCQLRGKLVICASERAFLVSC